MQIVGMKVIWKFPLPMNGTIEIPIGAEILDVQMQEGSPVLWAIVDPSAKKQQMNIYLVGTGQPLPDSLTKDKHMGSVQSGQFVWHVFGWEKII